MWSPYLADTPSTQGNSHNGGAYDPPFHPEMPSDESGVEHVGAHSQFERLRKLVPYPALPRQPFPRKRPENHEGRHRGQWKQDQNIERRHLFCPTETRQQDGGVLRIPQNAQQATVALAEDAARGMTDGRIGSGDLWDKPFIG